jgi:hypothetical protein
MHLRKRWNLRLTHSPALINVALVFHSGDLDGRRVVAAAGLCHEDPSVDGNLFLVRPPKQCLAQDTAIVRCTGRNTLEGQDRRHEIDVTYRDTDLDATLVKSTPQAKQVLRMVHGLMLP